jgi:hypothetical protein
MANHPIPIDGRRKPRTPSHKTCCIPWGDTITIDFAAETDLVHIQTPPYSAAFKPPIPAGRFYPGDAVGKRKALRVNASVTIFYSFPGSNVLHTIDLNLKQKCPPGQDDCPTN